MSRRDSVRNDIAGLVGARMVTAGEPEAGQAFDEGLVKRLTGQDRTTARFMFHEFFEFAATFKIWLEGNVRPAIKSVGGAVWRRLLVIPFENTVPPEKRDGGLGDKLASPEEMSGILAWLVRGAIEWQRGGLQTPESVKAAVKEYRVSEDRFGPFLEECTSDNKRGYIETGKLMVAYKEWCENNGEKPESSTALGRALTEKGYKKSTGGAPRKWFGLELVDKVGFVSER
jgi:putative DNA primase/helicase